MMRKITPSASSAHHSLQPASFKKPIQMPATLFSKSPLKDRQNRSFFSNTPLRGPQQAMNMHCGSSTLIQNSERRKSISPLKQHARQSSNLPVESRVRENGLQQQFTDPTSYAPVSSRQSHQVLIGRAGTLAPSNSNAGLAPKQIAPSTSMLKKTTVVTEQSASNVSESYCTNHGTKQAKYIAILDDDEHLPYCEKCAILLASQGFKVVKVDEDNISSSSSSSSFKTKNMQQSHCNTGLTPVLGKSLANVHSANRKRQIQAFLKLLQQDTKKLEEKRQRVQDQISRSDQEYQSQFSIIREYYDKVEAFLCQHRKAVEDTLAQQKSKAQATIIQKLSEIDSAIKDSQFMQSDIQQSFHLILQAEEKQFRPILDSFKQNMAGFQKISSSTMNIAPIQTTIVSMGEPEALKQVIYESINVHMQFRGGNNAASMAPQVQQSVRNNYSSSHNLFAGPVGKSISNISEKLSGDSSINFSFEGGRVTEEEGCDQYQDQRLQAAEECDDYEYTRSNNGYLQGSGNNLEEWLDSGKELSSFKLNAQNIHYSQENPLAEDQLMNEDYQAHQEEQQPGQDEQQRREFEGDEEGGFMKSSVKDPHHPLFSDQFDDFA